MPFSEGHTIEGMYCLSVSTLADLGILELVVPGWLSSDGFEGMVWGLMSAPKFTKEMLDLGEAKAVYFSQCQTRDPTIATPRRHHQNQGSFSTSLIRLFDVHDRGIWVYN